MHTIFIKNCRTFVLIKLIVSNKLNDMEKEIKKFLYAGVDLAAAASEKFQASVQELVSKGKISADEGKQMVDDLFAKNEERKAEFESKYKEFSEKLGLNKKKSEEEELDSLRKKVADLEAKLAKSKAASAK
jgi:polyhydroxyalkanoate synthesis regulator phasin